MSVISLRPSLTAAAHRMAAQGMNIAGAVPVAGAEAERFDIALMRAGHIDGATLMAAMAQTHFPVIEYLIQHGHVPEALTYKLLAAHWAIGLADFTRLPVDPHLLSQIDPAMALAQHWVPWRKSGAQTIIVCAYPEEMEKRRAEISQIFGPIAFALAPRRLIEAQILAKAGRLMARDAETRLSDGESCRNFAPKRLYLPLAGLTLLLLGLFAYAPQTGAIAVLGTGIALAFVLSALKWAALLRELWPLPSDRLGESDGPRPLAHPQTTKPTPKLTLVSRRLDLPMISVMVPLYHESRIVARLIRRLEQLDYPRRALEIILLTENNDSATAQALSCLKLPAWVRVLTVPEGEIRTKPRALNYGLDHCKGEIIGVYDAEDAPDPQQLRAVAQAFAKGDARLGCLQGRLDYYNPNRNWISRCFTMEYATWWRIVLPGYARMGLPIPLGGTTLFFRRDILKELGAWDAHNVTEDADLGLRLARKGYHTQLLDSTTYEEANSQVIPWIKQRSRWIKGYIMTYATHMRRPFALWRDLGAWGFFGVQMMFAGTVINALLAPFIFGLWGMAFGLIDRAIFGLPDGLMMGLAVAGLLAEMAMFALGYAAMRRTHHRMSPLWLASMVFYNLLASLAAYKALYEVLTKPFYWDKTAHGLFDDEASPIGF